MIKLTEVGDLGDRMVLGLPYGQGGAIPGAVEPGVLDTFSSPDVVQNPDKFGTLVDKSKITANATGSMQKIAPYGPYTGQSPENYEQDVDDIKYKVTPDEVIMGIDYEMKKLVLKDKQVAKQNVVKNLKKDPKYYSKLHMLGVYPDDQESNSIPDEGMSESKKSYVPPSTKENLTTNDKIDYRTDQEKAISDIIREMYDKKLKRRSWGSKTE